MLFNPTSDVCRKQDSSRRNIFLHTFVVMSYLGYCLTCLAFLSTWSRLAIMQSTSAQWIFSVFQTSSSSHFNLKKLKVKIIKRKSILQIRKYRTSERAACSQWTWQKLRGTSDLTKRWISRNDCCFLDEPCKVLSTLVLSQELGSERSLEEDLSDLEPQYGIRTIVLYCGAGWSMEFFKSKW